MMARWAWALLLVGGTAQATGFTAGDLETAAKRIDASGAQIAAETERLRLAIAYDPAAAIGARAPEERRILATALGTGPGKGDVRARWLMGGAIAQMGGASRTILYHPLARSWLTLGWVRAPDGTWQVATATLTSAGPSRWTGADGAYLRAFAADYRRTHGMPGDQPALVGTIESDRWLVGLARLSGPAWASAIAAVRRMAVRGATGSPADLLPAGVRASFLPVAGFARADGGQTLLLGSPVAPTLFLAADFGSSATAPDHLTFLNLVKAGEQP